MKNFYLSLIFITGSFLGATSIEINGSKSVNQESTSIDAPADMLPISGDSAPIDMPPIPSDNMPTLPTDTLANDSLNLSKEHDLPKPILNTNPQQKVKEINENTYQEIINLLKPKNEDPEIVKSRLALEKEKIEQERMEKQLEEEKLKEIEGVQFEEKTMLPNPNRSIKIGDKVIVYGIYKEKVVASLSDKSIINYKLEDRAIKLKEGDSFGLWKISELNENFVMYENIETKENIKKYY